MRLSVSGEIAPCACDTRPKPSNPSHKPETLHLGKDEIDLEVFLESHRRVSVAHFLGRLRSLFSAWTLTCRGTSLTRERTPLGPYRSPMPRVLGGS